MRIKNFILAAIFAIVALSANAKGLSLKVYNPGTKAIFPVSLTIVYGKKDAALIDAQFQKQYAEEVVKEIMDAVPQTPMASTPLAVLEEEHTEARGSFLDRFRTILQQNLHDSELNVERIGEKMGMSRVQLYRKVKSLTGMTPVELLRKYRLSRGRQLLETTDLSISEIAYDVGFTAPSYFAKCFKDEFGISPGEVRQAKEK